MASASGMAHWRAVVATVAVTLCVATTIAPSAGAQDAPDYLSWANPGPYRAPQTTDFSLRSFSSNQPIVGTYFFYWFDADTLRASGERFPFTPVDEQTQSFL